MRCNPLKKTTPLIAFIIMLLSIEFAGSVVLLAQDQVDIRIEEVAVQSIYIEGYNGSIIIKIRVPQNNSNKVRIDIRRTSVSGVKDLDIMVVKEEKFYLQGQGFAYHVYTIRVDTGAKTHSRGADAPCRPLILNISLTLVHQDKPNQLYDSKLIMITVCSITHLNRISEKLELIAGDIRDLENLIKGNITIFKNSLRGLENSTTAIINAILGLGEDLRKINTSMTIKSNALGSHLNKVVDDQASLRLLVYINLATSLTSLLLSAILILITLISRTRKETSRAPEEQSALGL